MTDQLVMRVLREFRAFQGDHQKLRNRLAAAERRIGELEARVEDIPAQNGGAVSQPVDLDDWKENKPSTTLTVAEPLTEGWPRKWGERGPFYQLSNGQKVRGKAEAQALQDELDNRQEAPQ